MTDLIKRVAAAIYRRGMSDYVSPELDDAHPLVRERVMGMAQVAVEIVERERPRE